MYAIHNTQRLIFAQLVIEREDNKPFNFRRYLNMAIIGAFLVGPVLHVWYGFLNRMIPAQTVAGTIQRLACDQLIFAPPFIPIFFGALFTLEGKLDELEGVLRETFWPSLKTNWQLWIPAQFITFRFVPQQLQVTFVTLVAFIWNSYLSWQSHKHHSSPTSVTVVEGSKDSHGK